MGRTDEMSERDRMRVIEIEGGAGAAETLRLAERPNLTAGPGQVRIAVRAAGINRPDLLQRQGMYPPPPGASDILGLEVAGEIDQVGDGVSDWAAGDRVCALLGGGGYADQAVADARHCLPIPSGLNWIEAAALPEVICTVFANVFETGALRPGETLLVHGATSGIGVAAIQMAKASGARVIATSRTSDKAEAARRLGADVSLVSADQGLETDIRGAGGVDVVLDMVGQPFAALHQTVLKPLGRWVVIATQGGALAEVDLMRLMLKRIALTGSTLRSRSADEKARLISEVRSRVWPWVEAGLVRPPIDAIYPIEDAKTAHLRLEAGGHVGKIMLTL